MLSEIQATSKLKEMLDRSENNFLFWLCLNRIQKEADMEQQTESKKFLIQAAWKEVSEVYTFLETSGQGLSI